MTMTGRLEGAICAVVSSAKRTRESLKSEESKSLSNYDSLMSEVLELLAQLKSTLSEEQVSLADTARNIHEHTEETDRQVVAIEKMMHDLQGR
jgi:predicted  nucleic acid-binding Zn-ribbon protein